MRPATPRRPGWTGNTEDDYYYGDNNDGLDDWQVEQLTERAALLVPLSQPWHPVAFDGALAWSPAVHS